MARFIRAFTNEILSEEKCAPHTLVAFAEEYHTSPFFRILGLSSKADIFRTASRACEMEIPLSEVIEKHREMIVFMNPFLEGHVDTRMTISDFNLVQQALTAQGRKRTIEDALLNSLSQDSLRL